MAFWTQCSSLLDIFSIKNRNSRVCSHSFVGRWIIVAFIHCCRFDRHEITFSAVILTMPWASTLSNGGMILIVWEGTSFAEGVALLWSGKSITCSDWVVHTVMSVINWCAVLYVLMGSIGCAFTCFVNRNTTSCIIPDEETNVRFCGIGTWGIAIW